MRLSGWHLNWGFFQENTVCCFSPACVPTSSPQACSLFHLEQTPVAHSLAQSVQCPRPLLCQGPAPLGSASPAASPPSVASSFVHALTVVLFSFTPSECLIICNSFWFTDSTHSNVDTDLLFSNISLMSLLGIRGRRESLEPAYTQLTNLTLYQASPPFLWAWTFMDE